MTGGEGKSKKCHCLLINDDLELYVLKQCIVLSFHDLMISRMSLQAFSLKRRCHVETQGTLYLRFLSG